MDIDKQALIFFCAAAAAFQESIESPGVDSIFLGMAFTKSEKEDRVIVSDLRGTKSQALF